MENLLQSQESLFDYASLDTPSRTVVYQIATEIKGIVRQSVLEIGQRLTIAKRHLVHGQWELWLSSEFAWSDRTARRMMQAATVFKSDTVSDLNIATTALYILASDTTPPEAREEALARAEAGEWITKKTARQIVDDHRTMLTTTETTPTFDIIDWGTDDPEPSPVFTPPPTLPRTRYDCLVIDPPWEMTKIQRDVRPNQVDMDYPSMTIDELQNLPVGELAADNAHVYLWATHKHLPHALALATSWGFRYQCLLTWVKNVGFTPYSFMYSTEHVLFCRRGSVPLIEMGRRLDFQGKVREHSRKPEEFYQLVRDVSPGRRLELFARERRPGFDAWGNEVDRFSLEPVDANSA